MSTELVLSAVDKTPDELADEIMIYLQQQGICPSLEDDSSLDQRTAGTV